MAVEGAAQCHTGLLALSLRASIEGHHAIVICRTTALSTQVTIPSTLSLFLSLCFLA